MESSPSLCRRASLRRGPRIGRPASWDLGLGIFGNTPSRWGRRVRALSLIRAVPLRRRVMRTYDVVLSCGLIALALGFSPAASFDGLPSDAAPGQRPAPSATQPPAAVQRATPNELTRSGLQALRSGKPDQAVTSLEYAAGQPGVAVCRQCVCGARAVLSRWHSRYRSEARSGNCDRPLPPRGVLFRR